MKPNQIDKLLDKVAATKKSQRCRTCQSAEASAIIARYYERRDAGEAMPSLMHLHRQLIQPEFGICYGAVRNHVTYCLGRSVTSGEKQ